MSSNLEQELADRIAARYNIDSNVSLEIVEDVINIYELKDKEFSEMFVTAIRSYDNTYGRLETLGFLVHHLEVDEDEAERIYNRIV